MWEYEKVLGDAGTTRSSNDKLFAREDFDAGSDILQPRCLFPSCAQILFVRMSMVRLRLTRGCRWFCPVLVDKVNETSFARIRLIVFVRVSDDVKNRCNFQTIFRY